MKKRKSSIGSIVGTAGIEQERSGASSCVEHCLIICKKRSRPNGGVVVAEIVALEREETNGRIESAGRQS